MTGTKEPAAVDGARWIHLSNKKDQWVLVDEADFDWLNKYRWHWAKPPKAVLSEYALSWVEGRMVSMHRLIIAPGADFQVDHKNHNGLDNRRKNLRVATKSQNEGNTSKRCTNTSGFKGVFWDKTRKKWLAQLHTKEGFVHLGRYLDKEDAARAYDKAAKLHFGEFAFLNFGTKP